MNEYHRAISIEIRRHGVPIKYISTHKIRDEIKGTVVTSEITIDIPKSYPKHKTANQYYQPNLVNKEVIEFRILPQDVTPKRNDIIELNGKRYIIDSFKQHMALGEVCLYIVTAYHG